MPPQEQNDPSAPTPPHFHGMTSVPVENALLFDRYRVIRQLGRGGMGVVLLARDGELGVDIAIKLVPDLLVQDQVALDELKHEVLRGMALTHPGIVRTHGFVRDTTMAAIAMEYVDGGNFNDLRLAHTGSCFDTPDLLPWLQQLGPVLDYAHFEIKIAHRDLKPHNLMYTRSGRIKVADFGISSTLNDTASRVSMQRASSGTPAYMSPQQIMGERPSHLDDVYALGATIYELLTGKPPFYKGHVLAQALESQPVPMALRREELGVTCKEPIPPQWEETIAACLAKEPRLRPQSVGEVIERLKRTAIAPSPAKTPTARDEAAKPAVSPVRRPRHHASSGGKWIAALVAAGLVTAGAAYVIQRQPPSRAALVAPPPILPPAEAPRITSPDELPHGRVGDPYQCELTAEGGAPPYRWSASGSLPNGLTAGESGVIQGVPLVAGESEFGINVTGSDELSAGKQVKLIILESNPPPAEAPPPVAIPPVAEIPETTAQVTATRESIIPMIEASKESPHENSLGMKFVPAGTQDVLMSIWLTRVSDFRAFVTATGYDAKTGVHSVKIGGNAGFFNLGDNWERPGFAQTDSHPVSGVSWNDANAFCQWLTKNELKKGTLPKGFLYRLPADMEWKNALPVALVNPGKFTRYPWGTAWPPPDSANFAGGEMRDGGVTPTDWPILVRRDHFPRTTPVDQFPANRFGLHDLFGNLWQFCEDPTDSGKQSYLMRGGSWASAASEELGIDTPSKKRRADARVVDAGFRCVIARTP